MVVVTRASGIAELRRRTLKQIDDRRREIEELEKNLRLIDELARMETPSLHFDEEELSVSWTGGAMTFRQSGKAQFFALKAVYESEETRITHADLAFEIYKNDLASVKNVTYSLSRKMEKHKCPFELKHDQTSYWLETAVEHY